MKRILLPNTIMSPADLERVTQEVRAYANWFNKELVKRRVNGSEHKISPAPYLSNEGKEVLRQWKDEGAFDRRKLEMLVANLEELQHNPIITVTLAAPADTALQQTITDWCRKYIREDLLIAFQLDRTILGGLIIRAGSHIVDSSFRTKLLTTPTPFSEVLRRV